LLDNQHFDLDLSSKIDFSIDTIAINISLNIRSTATTQAQFVINLLDSESLPYHEPLQKHLRTFGKDYYTLKKNILYLPEKNKFSKNKLRFSIENIEKTGKIESQKLQIAIFKISKF
jgi:flavin reductase (DIM6/NTAB) family NADH-FMN oxidoreductase RutF